MSPTYEETMMLYSSGNLMALPANVICLNCNHCVPFKEKCQNCILPLVWKDEC